MKKLTSFVSLLLVSAMTIGFTACSGNSTSSSQSAAGASSAASGASSASSAPAKTDATVTIGQASEVANLNPLLQPRTPDTNVQCMIFDYLVTPDEKLNYKGDLAESWDVSKDGLVYTFHLVKGATWQDGKPFTADDVAFTLTAMAAKTYTGGASGRVMSIKGAQEYQDGKAKSIPGIVVKDPNTVEITLTSPNAAFLGNMYTPILPKHILGDVDPGTWAKTDFNRKPIGTGKYKFVSWKAGQYIELERNDSYWGQKPSIQHVFVRFGDETTLTAALCKGEINVLYGLGASDVDTVDASKTAEVKQYKDLNMYYIGLNLLDPNLKDLRVRQALSYALDKKTMAQTVFGDYGYAIDDIFPLNHWSHSTTVATYPYNPAKAKSLLEEAGYTMNKSTGFYEKDGKPLHLTYDLVTSSDKDSYAALVQQYWKAIGVDVKIIDQDFSTLAYKKLFPQNTNGTQREVTAKDFQAYTLGFGVEADPDEYRDYFTTSKGAGSWNFIHYTNPTVDDLLKKQLTLTDTAARADCFHQIADLVSKDIPWIPTYGQLSLTGVTKNVGNFACDYRGVTFQIEKWTMS